MSESVSASADAGGSLDPGSGGNNVKIKIQTSKKSINYSIARVSITDHCTVLHCS